MSQASKLLTAAVNLSSSYTAYAYYTGGTSVGTPSTDTADFYFNFAELGIPAGSTINSIKFKVQNWDPTPLHGTSERKVKVNGTYISENNITSGVDYEILGLSTWGENNVELRFKSGTSSTSYPAYPASGTATRTNTSTLGWVYVTVVVDYTLPYTNCGAPTTVGVSKNNVKPGETVSLSWSGASSGAYNPITGYKVLRATAPGGPYTEIATVTTGNTYGSLNVVAQSGNGASYYYAVKPIGTVAGYDGAQSTAYATLTTYYTAPTAPSLAINSPVAAGQNANLSWSGAAAGTNNPVTGYAIYKDGVYYTTVGAGVTSASVPANGTAGQSASYTVYTLGTYSNSAASSPVTVYTYGDPVAPSSVGVSDANPLADTDVTFSWSGAATGAYNPITGYEVWRSEDGTNYTLLDTVLTTATSGSKVVRSKNALGGEYWFKVKTKGQYSNSALSGAVKVTSKAYTKCTAPTLVDVDSSLIDSGSNTTLRWYNAVQGTNNPITGYRIERRLGTGAWSTLQTVTTTATSGSLVVAASTTMGQVYEYRVITLGTAAGYDSDASTDTASVTTQTYSACSTPTLTIDVSEVDGGTNANLNWTESSQGTNNPVTGYKVERRLSGGAWSTLQTLAANVRTLAVTSHSTMGQVYEYRVIALGTKVGFDSSASNTVTLTTRTYTNCSAPSSVTIDDAVKDAGQTTTLRWSGALPGTNNPISGYKIERKLGSGAWDWLTNVSAATLSLVVTAHSTMGSVYAYRVTAIATKTGYDSSASSSTVTLTTRTYTVCTAPTLAQLSLVVAESTVDLSWSGAAGGTNNGIVRYRIEYADSTDGVTFSVWNALTTVDSTITNGSASLAVPATRGNYRKYRIRTEGAAGDTWVSAWKETAIVRKNRLPIAHSIVSPTMGSECFNVRPYLVVSANAEPDAQTQTVRLSIDGGAFADIGTIPAAGGTLAYRLPSDLSLDNHSLSVKIADSQGAENTVINTAFTVSAPAWTRVIGPGTVFSTPATPHKPDIEELLNRVNKLRLYYGLTTITLTGVGFYKEWLNNMKSLQNALTLCYTTANRTPPAWITPPTNRPNAAVFNQIRSAVESL